jgi:hypothetical protein
MQRAGNRTIRSMFPKRWHLVWRTSLLVFAIILSRSLSLPAQSADLSIVVLENGKPIPARIHLKPEEGKPIKPPPWPSWNDHFVCEGKVSMEVPAGRYLLEVEHGPEFSIHRSGFSVGTNGTNIAINLQRLADLAAEGWWSGELHVHRPPNDAELLMRAEDLHVAQFITWWNKQNLWTNSTLPENPLRQFDGNRFAHVMAGEDERDGGALLFYNLKQPLAIIGATRHYPSALAYAADARGHSNAWIDMEKPFWWDFPVWVASGLCDSVGIANNHMQRSGMLDSEAWGRPRSRERFPSPRGNGFWTQEIYYQLLNCGVRLPPSAGSASGVLPNPVGYNRVYVHAGSELNYDDWWRGLRAGKAFVSNGPLLRCRANGKLPGEIFVATDKLEIQIDAVLTTRDPIPALEIVHNGKVVRTVPAKTDGPIQISKLMFAESGWFLVRAISNQPETFRFASSAPFYVEIGPNKRRISKASAEFFLEWVQARTDLLRIQDPGQKEAVLRFHRDAEKFWREKVAAANAE